MWKDNGSFMMGTRCNYPGNDISVLTLNSVGECSNACNGNSKCNHFTYQANLKLCNLKSVDIGSNPIGDDARERGT